MESLPWTRRIWHSIESFIERFWRAFGGEDLAGIAAQMTYYFMLALFPLLILLVTLVDALPLPASMSANLAQPFQRVSPQLGTLVQNYLTSFQQRPVDLRLLLWGVAALWAASRGVAGARKGLDRVMGCTQRHHIAKRKLLDLSITLAGVVFIALANLLLLGGQQLARFLMKLFGLAESFAVTWAYLRWPMVLLLLFSGVVLAYRFLPSRRLRFRHLMLGAIPTVMGWLVLGSGFRFYLRNLGHFDEIYGSLTSFFLLMFFLWLVSLCLLIGGQTANLMAREERGSETKAAGEC